MVKIPLKFLRADSLFSGDFSRFLLFRDRSIPTHFADKKLSMDSNEIFEGVSLATNHSILVLIRVAIQFINFPFGACD